MGGVIASTSGHERSDFRTNRNPPIHLIHGFRVFMTARGRSKEIRRREVGDLRAGVPIRKSSDRPARRSL